MDYDKKLSRNFFILTYEILNNILVFLLIAFSLFLLTESVLPGIISSHLSFLKMVLIIFVVLGLIMFLGRKNDFQFSGLNKTGQQTGGYVRWIIIAAIIFFLILTANSLFKFSSWEILIITFSSCFALIYFYKILFTS